VCRKKHNPHPSSYTVDGKLHEFLLENFPEIRSRLTVDELCSSQQLQQSQSQSQPQLQQFKASAALDEDLKTSQLCPVETSPSPPSALLFSSPSSTPSSTASTRHYATISPRPLSNSATTATTTTTTIKTKRMAAVLQLFVYSVITAVLSLLPIYWLLLLCMIGYYSLILSFVSAIFILSYPQLMWVKHFNKSKGMEMSWLYNKLVTALFSYFPITLTRTYTLDPTQRYLFGYHPHGMYCFGLFSVSCPTISGWDSLFPGVRCAMGVANSILCVPLLCDIMRGLGFIPASRDSMQSALYSGHSVIIVPGGIAEMFEGDRDCDQETIFLHTRKGFIHFAITNGLTLVPVYGFGENKTFKRYHFLKPFRQMLSRKFKIALQLFSGRFCSLLPYNNPIHVVVGKPIELTQCLNPSEQQVEAVLCQYKAELLQLFEEHKCYVGYSDRRLVIV
jgi:2-acylglycerol O-acyltransferase 2